MCFLALIILFLVNKCFVLGCDDFDDWICPYVFDRTGQVQIVDIQLKILQLSDFQDVQGKLFVKASMISIWNDTCGWELAKKMIPNQVENSTSVTMECKLFRLPLLTQANHNKARAYLDTGNMPVEVYKSGTIIYYGRNTWMATCKGNFSKFPFDTHLCILEYYIWYSTSFMRFGDVSLKFAMAAKYDSNTLALFSAHYPPLQRSQTSYACSSRTCYFDRIKFFIHLKRKWFPYYFLGIFLPMALLSILQLFTFLLPYNEMDRTTFSGTIFIANALISSQISAYIPQTSEHIIVVTTSNLASLFSMISTLFFVFSFTCQNCYKEITMKRIQKFSFVTFFLFSLALYVVTFICIAT